MTGEAGHAGGVPMRHRRDALLGAAGDRACRRAGGHHRGWRRATGAAGGGAWCRQRDRWARRLLARPTGRHRRAARQGLGRDQGEAVEAAAASARFGDEPSTRPGDVVWQGAERGHRGGQGGHQGARAHGAAVQGGARRHGHRVDHPLCDALCTLRQRGATNLAGANNWLKSSFLRRGQKFLSLFLFIARKNHGLFLYQIIDNHSLPKPLQKQLFHELYVTMPEVVLVEKLKNYGF